MDSLGWKAFSDTDRAAQASYSGFTEILILVLKHGRREDFCHDFTKQGKARKHPGKNQRSCGKKQSPALNPGLIHNARPKG